MLNESNLHGYQKTAIDHILNTSHAGLFLDMGLGKTVSTLTALNALMFEELDVSNVLVVAPKRVAESVWTAEIDKWKHLKHLRVSRIIGTPKQREAALRAKADIYVISRDNIAWLCTKYGGSMLPFDMLIVDESSSFKNHKSVRFKALRQVQPSFKRVVILTGTPAPNGLIDLWSQIYLLDRGERLGKFIGQYRKNYFTPGAARGEIVYNYKIRDKGEEKIYEAIQDICISMKAEDYLDLPDTIYNYIELDLPEDIKKKYREFEEYHVLELLESNGEDISAANAAALSVKLLQFANGAVYDENKDYHHVHDVKLDALEEIIEAANGKPVLIAWSFRHDLERIKQRLKKYNVRELKKEKDIKDWNDKKIEVLAMHPASGGHGLNLQEGGNIICWYGQTWSLELYQQLNARLNRQGKKYPTMIHHLAIKNTIDMDVIEARKKKTKKQDGLLKAVKARLGKYRK